MRAIFRRRGETAGLPPVVRAAVTAADTDQSRTGSILATAATTARGESAWLVATTHDVALVAESEPHVRWRRPWHEVDTASWGREAGELTITFVDGGRPTAYPLGREDAFLRVLRERVQASAVTSVELDLPRPKRARVAIRQDLATGELLDQVVLGRGTRPSPEIDAHAQQVLAILRDEVGLPPTKR